MLLPLLVGLHTRDRPFEVSRRVILNDRHRCIMDDAVAQPNHQDIITPNLLP